MGWEDEGYGGDFSATDVTAAEERGGGFEGQQAAEYGGGNGDRPSGFSREQYDPLQFTGTQGGRGRFENIFGDILKGAAMTLPGVSQAVGAYRAYRGASGFLKDPAGSIRGMLGSAVDRRLESFAPGASGFLGRQLGTKTGTIGGDVKKGVGPGQPRSGTGTTTFGGGDTPARAQITQTQQSQQSFNPQAWDMLAQLMRANQPSRSGRVYQYRGGR